MNGTVFLLLWIITLSGIASAGCIVLADELNGIVDEIKQLTRRIL